MLPKTSSQAVGGLQYSSDPHRGEGSMLTFASQWVLSREDAPSQSSVPSTDLAADDLHHTEAKSQVMKQLNVCAAEA